MDRRVGGRPRWSLRPERDAGSADAEPAIGRFYSDPKRDGLEVSTGPRQEPGWTAHLNAGG
jgi:hypothetical protein